MARLPRARNVLFMTALDCGDHRMDYVRYAVRTWRHFCRRHGVRLVLHQTPLFDPARLPPSWQKLTVFSVLQKQGIRHDQVAIVDVDTMVSWTAPDLFELTGRRLAAVPESNTESAYYVYRTLEDFRPFFKGVEVPWYEYFNSGVLFFNEAHAPLFDQALRFFWRHRKRLYAMRGVEEARPTAVAPTAWNEQTPLNYLVRKLEVPLTLLPRTCNLQDFSRSPLLREGLFTRMAHVWHFNGFDKAARTTVMKATYERLRELYQ